MIPNDYRPIVEVIRSGGPFPFELLPSTTGFCKLRLRGRKQWADGALDIRSRPKTVALFCAPYLLLIAKDDEGECRYRFHIFEVVMDCFELVWAAYLDFPGGIYEQRGLGPKFVSLLHPKSQRCPLADRVKEESEMRFAVLSWLQARNIPMPCRLD